MRKTLYTAKARRDNAARKNRFERVEKSADRFRENDLRLNQTDRNGVSIEYGVGEAYSSPTLKEGPHAKQCVTKLSGSVSILIISCGLLAAGATAVGQSSADNQSRVGQCSNRMLWGDYGFSSEGLVIPAPNVTAQFRSVGTTHFDGRGDLSFLEHTVINGSSLESGWTRSTGTYTVNADCTGMLTINTPNSPVPVNASFVVFRRGEEVRAVGNSNAISTVWDRLSDRKDDRD
jgi:hypothetical protein